MEVVYRCCCGIDVHKKMIVACLDEGGKRELREFGTTTSAIKELANWLTEAGCEMIAMESTGVFWKPLYNLFELMDLNAIIVNASHISEPSSEASAEELRAQLMTVKRQNDELKKALYSATKQAEESEEKAARALAEFANERQELRDLRELIFNRENDADDTEAEAVEDGSGLLPYINKNRIVVFGGHDTWLKAIRPLLPSVQFVPRGQNPNVDMIRSSDVVWIQANSLPHKNYYKIIHVVRTHQIPVRYFGYASARKCAMQLARENMKG